MEDGVARGGEVSRSERMRSVAGRLKMDGKDRDSRREEEDVEEEMGRKR